MVSTTRTQRRGHLPPSLRLMVGFSLVELVSVMVLVAILSTFVVQKFSGTSGYDEYVVRDQLIEAIRFAQQRAMYDHEINHCYRVSITSSSYAVQRSTNNGSTFSAMHDLDFLNGDGAVADAMGKVTLSSQTILFDGLGNSVTACGGATAANRSISISGASTLQFCVYSTGYVSASAC